MMGEGREGDWECSGCKNRNYAFRSFCNRCKQPRLLVDNKTPADSKWLPRIGDWICTACTNNNYASREKCKKCGQPKDIAAIPAISLHGASAFPVFSHHSSARGPGLWPNGDGGGHCQSLPLSSAWPLRGPDNYGVVPRSAWAFGGDSPLPCPNAMSQLLAIPKGWRNGDWMCKCGFHNYSSRAQCKKCNSIPPGACETPLGTKRLASEELVDDVDNKRPNVGQYSYLGFEHMARSFGGPNMGLYGSFSNITAPLAPSFQLPLQFQNQATASALLGKGTKQWRDGDWMCMNCNNHNYASRAQCNRCKTQKDTLAQPVDAM